MIRRGAAVILGIISAVGLVQVAARAQEVVASYRLAQASTQPQQPPPVAPEPPTATLPGPPAEKRLPPLPNEADVLEAVRAEGEPSRERIMAYAEEITPASGGDLRSLALAGVAWQMAGQPDRALELYERALALEPWSEELYNRIAAIMPDGLWVYVRGRRVQWPDGVEPIIRNGRTLVPIRAIAEALGARVEWNPETATVTITLADNTVNITVDQPFAYVNRISVPLDVPATILPPGRTVVPLRFVAENLGLLVRYHRIRDGAAVVSVRG